jgi:hypothetical protein
MTGKLRENYLLVILTRRESSLDWSSPGFVHTTREQNAGLHGSKALITYTRKGRLIAYR